MVPESFTDPYAGYLDHPFLKTTRGGSEADQACTRLRIRGTNVTTL
jgi:hypothetical protein